MAYTDKTLTCVDCGSSFTFGAEEQELYASRGYTNEPKRCPSCRDARKASRGQGSGYSDYRPSREMFPATCSSCGVQTQVPFQPRSNRPVYCSDCYRKMKPAGPYQMRTGRG